MRLSLLLLVSIVGGLSAQSSAPKVIEQDPIIGIRSGRAVYSDSIVMRSCPQFVLSDPGPQDVGHDGAPFRTWCGVDTTYALPDADGSRWRTAIYSRWSEYPVDPDRRPRRGISRDTVRLISSVLYSRSTSGDWQPEWLGTVAALYVRWIDIETVARPDRSLLAGVRYCFNGTGGCWQHFLRRSAGKWTPVVETFMNQFPSVPDGRIGKGPGVSLPTLTGSFGLYSNRDGNCCPSRELAFVLEQRGDTLRLKSHEVRKTP